MDSESQQEFYSLSEAAQALGVHYETAARWVRAGKLSGVRVSRRKVLVPKEACRALVGGFPKGPRVGSPQRWMKLVGTLTSAEAAKLRTFAEDFEKVEQGE